MNSKDLTWLDDHRKEIEVSRRDGTKSTKRRLCLKDWDGVIESANSDSDEEGNSDASASEGVVNVHDKLQSIIEQHQNQPIHIGGIITLSEEKVGRSGKPYGNYILEDYEGSYKFALFGDTYSNLAPMLKLNCYVYLTGTLQQSGAGRQWFRERPMDEAEYELVWTQAEPLDEVQKKQVETLTINIPIEQVTKEFNEELTDQIHQHPGKIKLKIQVVDETQHRNVTFISQSCLVTIDKEFYHWLRVQELNHTLTHKVE